jgi:pimeloyl-ACP methyl ester carboxylesterase
MNDMITHRVTSADGTEIAGRVAGTGPALVMLPAGPGDGETSWGALAPHLQDCFTCHLLDTRGRGASGAAADHRPQRLVEDVLAYVDSLGEPAGLVAWGSPLWSRVAAEGNVAVVAVAAYEPGADEAMEAATSEQFEGVIGAAAQLAAEGGTGEAARVVVEGIGRLIYTAEELASGAPSAFWSRSAENIPVFLREVAAESDGRPGPTDPTVLARVRVPVLLLEGSETQRWFAASVRHVATYLNDARVERIHGAAHFAPVRASVAVAGVLAEFFTPLLAPSP